MDKLDISHAMNSTIFEMVRGTKKHLPTEIKVTWDPQVASEMRALMPHDPSDAYPKANKDGATSTSMDLSQNESLLKTIEYDLICWRPGRAAAFLLQWAQSPSYLISTKKTMRSLTGIILLFCQYATRKIEVCNSKLELIPKFNEIKDAFISLP